MTLVDQVRHLFVPGRCTSCDTWGASPLCSRCEAAIRWLPARASSGVDGIDNVRAACSYEGPARDVLKAFKLLGERRAARWLAVRMVTSARDLHANVFTWVPATRAAEAARGFNPAEELARPLARSLRLPVRRLLIKRRATLDSAGLSRDQRKANLFEAFEARGAVRGHVLLVDDILTTGATAAECASALRRAGAGKVSVVAFARAP